MEGAAHIFERAGLGKAPFTFVGSYESKYQAIPGDPNCPVQPGSSCDYCGQGIVRVCRVRDANGHEFKVGQDCVRRTGDAGLKRAVDKMRAAKDRAQRKTRAARVRTTLETQLADESIRARLASTPHPRGREGESLLTWAEWMMQHAGAAGRARVAKAITAAVSP